MLALQRRAGNAAVSRLLAREPAAPDAPAAGPTLTSPHPEVNGRPVEEVDADARARAARYRELVPKLRESSEASMKDEEEWYAKLGLFGEAIELFSKKHTDPSRWAAALAEWDKAQAALDRAIASPVAIGAINDLGLAVTDALESFQRATTLDHTYRVDFELYLESFSGAAETIHGSAVVVRDLSFAAAVAIASVALTPAVAGFWSGAGGTMGLGATGSAVVANVGTPLTLGAVGAVMEGAGQGLGTVGAQSAEALLEVVRGSDQALDAFDWKQVGEQAGEGFVRGFMDGVLAVAGAAAEKAIARNAAGPMQKLFGPANSSLNALILQRALTRAVSGGASGAVVGALQAGWRAAASGQDLAGIAAAMESGAVLGAGSGAVAGGAVGALEARSAGALQQQVAAELRELSAKKVFETDAMLKMALDEIKANPTRGTNAQLAELLPDAHRALTDPDAIASVIAEIWLEEHLLGIAAPRAAAQRYGAAALSLSGRRGAPIRVLPHGASYDPERFYREVVLDGKRFLDLAILDQAATFEHGAHTHLMQDRVVDRALARQGISSARLRSLFAGAEGAEGEQIGRDLWEGLYDSQLQDINTPEVVYPVMKRALGGIE